MESVDSNQSLDLFVQSNTPTCSIDATGLEALALLQSGWKYIVVLDLRGRPQGLFTSQCALSWLDIDKAHPKIEFSCDLASHPLSEVNLEPLSAIASSTTVTEFLDRISQYQYSASIWAVVDRNYKYIGVIEVLPLMRQLVWQHTNSINQPLQQLKVLINQLPLPLMIRTIEGDVMIKNQAWLDSIEQAELQIDLTVSPLDLSQRYQYLGHNGQLLTWQVTQVGLQGSLQGLEIAIAQDISAQEQLSVELSGQNANLVRLNRLKDEFLACISHELKTPLTSVIGMANLLNTQAVGELNDRQSRYLRMIHQSGRHLTDVIDNIVDLAKAETGQLELYLETIEIKQTCQQSIQQARKLSEQDTWIYKTNLTTPELSQLEVQLHIDPKITNIVADAERIQQMLVNLLSNAIKFTEASQTPQVGLTVHQLEGWIAFTVWDKGIGIPEDKQHLIFQKFQQLESTLTRRFDGTGLGLILTRHLARLHGGDITFVSQVGEGSEFSVLLPPIPPQAVEVESLEMSISTGRLVLIVETLSKDINRLTNNLTAWGYRVVVARLGIEALEKARKLQPCLIVLSPDLPMLSGWDVLALLKQDTATRHIRVVMAIEMSEKVSEQDQPANQADGFLIKPVQASDLSMFLPHYYVKTTSLRLLCLGQSLDEQLMNALQKAGHRLIEATDIEQGDTLARIWHPDLILLNATSEKLPDCLKHLTDAEFLPNLPILVMGDLSFSLMQQFASLNLQSYVGETGKSVKTWDFHKVLKRAVGHLRSPNILILNFTRAEALTQSLHQYLSLAGFHVHLLQNPELLATQVQTSGIDAILITLHDQDWTHQKLLSTQVQETLQNLSYIAACPPVIVIDGGSHNYLTKAEDAIAKLLKLATAVLKQPDVLVNLLPTLRQCLSL